MADSRGTLDALALQLAGLLQPLDERIGAGDLRGLIAELGLQFPPSLDTDAALITAAETAVRRLRDMPPQVADLIAAIEAEDIPQVIARALQLAGTVAAAVPAVEDVGAALESAGAGSGIPAPELQQLAEELPRRLIDYVAVRQLEAVPGVAEALELIGVVERTPLPAVDAQHPAYVKRRLDLDALTAFVSSPATHLRAKYAWGDPAFDGSALLSKLSTAGARRGRAGRPRHEWTRPRARHRGPRAQGPHRPRPARAERADRPSVPDRPGPVRPGRLADQLVAEAQLLAGAEIVLQSNDTVPSIPPSGRVEGDVLVEWTGGRAGTPYLIVGQPGSSRLEARQFVVTAGVGFGLDAATGQASGDLRIGGRGRGRPPRHHASPGRRVPRRRSSAASASRPTSTSASASPPARGSTSPAAARSRSSCRCTSSSARSSCSALTLAVGLEGDAFPIELGVDIKAELGPLAAVVEKIGLRADCRFPADRGGNLGPRRPRRSASSRRTASASSSTPAWSRAAATSSSTSTRGEYAGALELDVRRLRLRSRRSASSPPGCPTARRASRC